MNLIQAKEVMIPTADGGEKAFIISKFPAVAGREIVAQYPVSALPKVGDYKVNEAVMLKLISYVAVDIEGKVVQLTTRALVDNHIPDWETLARLEIAMMEYNCSFFGNGRASTFFEGIAQKLQAFISQTLTDSLARSSEQVKPPSTN